MAEETGFNVPGTKQKLPRWALYVGAGGIVAALLLLRKKGGVSGDVPEGVAGEEFARRIAESEAASGAQTASALEAILAQIQGLVPPSEPVTTTLPESVPVDLSYRNQAHNIVAGPIPGQWPTPERGKRAVEASAKVSVGPTLARTAQEQARRNLGVTQLILKYAPAEQRQAILTERYGTGLAGRTRVVTAADTAAYTEKRATILGLRSAPSTMGLGPVSGLSLSDIGPGSRATPIPAVRNTSPAAATPARVITPGIDARGVPSGSRGIGPAPTAARIAKATKKTATVKPTTVFIRKH